MWVQDIENPNFLLLRCDEGCNCILRKIKKYESSHDSDWSSKNPKKGGIILQDENGKHLVIQSRGRLWGIPKGSVKNGESDLQCAIRELKEETGMETSVQKITHHIKVDKSKYFYSTSAVDKRKIVWNMESDATGGGWCTTQCMKKWKKKRLLRTTKVYSKVLDTIYK